MEIWKFKDIMQLFNCKNFNLRMHLQQRFYGYAIILSLVHCLSNCGAILNDTVVTFEMQGSTKYTPDSGGIQKDGYKLRVGFSKRSWLGVEFVENNNKNDLLVITYDEFYTKNSNPLRNGHKVTVDDYYISSDLVNEDREISNDLSSFNYVETKDYYIDIVRYVGSNNGEDWNGAAKQYSFTHVCFYTSNSVFDIDNLTAGIHSCYSYEIKNYYSTFKGEKLKQFTLNGYKTQINGWIDGPYVSANLYFYHQVPLFSYSKNPAVVIEIGTTQNEKGQDFYAYSPVPAENGDYFGKEVTSMAKDNTEAGGFQNSACHVEYWNADPAQRILQFPYTALGINFQRNISTHDPYDKKMKSTVVFCLYLFTEGTIVSKLSDKACQVIEIDYHFPRRGLSIKPASQSRLRYLLLMMLMILSMLI